MNWIRKNKLEFLIILVILIIAAFLRFYRLPEYMTFLGDEGRDMIIVKKFLTEFDVPFIGPPTSIGGMYNGPLYYYMMVIPTAIFWLNPIGSATMVALIGIATVFLIYYLTREWFGRVSAMLAAVLYSLSPVTIIYSRSSWNPNPAPFFTLLSILGLYKTYKTKNFKWLILIGFSSAFAVQMHYLALIMLFVLFIIWIIQLKSCLKERNTLRPFLKFTLISLFIFLMLMSPLVLFDLKHDLLNYKAFNKFFFEDRTETVNLNIFNTLERILPIYHTSLVSRYLSGDGLKLFISIIILLPIISGFYKMFSKKILIWPILTLSVWLLAGIVGLSLYKQTIYDHYLGFLNPAPFILIGSLAGLVRVPTWNVGRYWIGAVSVLVISLIIVNLQRSPLLDEPNNQLKRTQDIAKFVISQADGEPFNFALIAEHNYDAAYQYYLDLYGHKPKQAPKEITDQLFVVCEDKQCKPVGHPKHEIAAFGWTLIESEKNLSGVKVFKLIHNPAQPKQE